MSVGDTRDGALADGALTIIEGTCADGDAAHAVVGSDLEADPFVDGEPVQVERVVRVDELEPTVARVREWVGDVGGHGGADEGGDGYAPDEFADLTHPGAAAIDAEALSTDRAGFPDRVAI